jgi:hypothetical protein
LACSELAELLALSLPKGYNYIRLLIKLKNMQPEKAVVFGPIIIFFLFFGALAIGFLSLVFKVVRAGIKSSWKGVVIDKSLNERRDSDNHHKMNRFYCLIFKTDDGKTMKIAVTGQMYNDYNIGDRAEKKSGARWMEKVG